MPAELDEAPEDDSLDELKELLAAEGVDGDDEWSPEQMLGELEDTETPTPEARPRRRAGRQERSHRSEDEQVFRDLESQLTGTPLDLTVSEDHMTVTLGRVGAENSLEELVSELRRQKVTTGIDEKALAASLRRAEQAGPQYDVVVARGTAPVIHEPPAVREHLPPALLQADPSSLESLQHALAGPSAEVAEQWSGPVQVVHKGDILVDIKPAVYDAGVDVYGAPVEPEFDELPELLHGDQTQLSEDGHSVVASAYGYAGMLEGEPAVVLPIFVTPDSMAALFVCIDADSMAAPTEEEFDDLLASRWIESGVDTARALELRAALEAGEDVGRLVPIATGTQPVNGKNGSIVYVVPPTALVRWNELQAVLKSPDLDALASALAPLRGAGRQFHAVHQGDVVATRTPSQDGEPGCDVRGEDLTAEDGADVELAAGTNVEVDEDGLQMRASCAGWLAVYGSDQLSVVSPLWLSSDRLTAGLLHMHSAEAPCAPTADEFAELIAADASLQGLDVADWETAVSACESDIAVLVTGEQAQAGTDGCFDWAVSVGGRAGRILDDGSIDLRDRSLISVVEVGQLLGRLHPAQEGIPGKDALGAPIEPPELVEFEVVPDSRVETRPEDDGVIAFHALVEGGVSSTEEERRKRGRLTRRLRLGLYAVSEVEGDVDYSTGHIDFSGDVVIKGSVKPLFRVQATGSVTIEGSVEPGARIKAGHDIILSGGAIGAATRLQAGGLIQAKFIQQARVEAGSDIEVGSHVFEAFVRAGASIVIAGKGAGASRALVGGLAWAGGSIETPSLGSPTNARLRVVVGISPDSVHETEVLRDKLRSSEMQQNQILQQLGLEQLDAGRLQRLAEKASEAKRPEILKQLAHVVEFGLLRRELRARLEDMAATQRESARRAQLTVSGPIFRGAELRLGEYIRGIDEDAAKMRYHLVEDEDGRTAIQQDAL